MLATEVAKKMRRIPRSFHPKFPLQKTQPKTQDFYAFEPPRHLLITPS